MQTHAVQPTIPQKQEGPQKVQTKRPLTYAETVALSLVRFAQNDPAFATILARLYSLYSPSLPTPTRKKERILLLGSIETSTDIIMPRSVIAAARKAEWLLGQMAKKPIAGAAEAAGILLAQVEPKQLVVGMIQIKIPGITLGKLEKPFIKMPVVVLRETLQQHNLSLSQKIVKTCFAVFSRALTLAGNDPKKLDPEFGDWLFGDQAIELYTAKKSVLSTILEELRTLDVLHAAHMKNDEPIVLAISPAVRGDIATLHWDIEPISEE